MDDKLKQPKIEQPKPQVGNVPHIPQGGKVAQPKVDPVRQKIMEQGFSPKGWKPGDTVEVKETTVPKAGLSEAKSNQQIMNKMGLDKQDFVGESKPKNYKVYFDDGPNFSEVMDIQANSDKEAGDLAYEKRKTRGFGNNNLSKPSRIEEYDAGNPEERAKGFNALKEECKQFAEQFPWEENSKKSLMRTIDECSNADELFWGFLFNFYDNDIQSEMKAKYPGAVEKLDELGARNKEFYDKKIMTKQDLFDELDERNSPYYVAETDEEKAEREAKEAAEAEEKEFRKNNPYADWDESDVGKHWRY